MIPPLQNRFSEQLHSKQLQIYNQDILTWEPVSTPTISISNIPYYVSVSTSKDLSFFY